MTTGICVATCPGGTAQGGDLPVTVGFELGATRGVFNFSYQTFTKKDRLKVSMDGVMLHDTGCVETTFGNHVTVPITYAGQSTQVQVEVIPNCEGGTGTAWNFQVACPTVAP